jgi:hypothetical protein
MRMRTRIMRRGYKYTGWTAQRNQLIYESYRRGAEIERLAKAWTLRSGSVRRIIAEGNGGTVKARFFDEL